MLSWDTQRSILHPWGTIAVWVWYVGFHGNLDLGLWKTGWQLQAVPTSVGCSICLSHQVQFHPWFATLMCSHCRVVVHMQCWKYSVILSPVSGWFFTSCSQESAVLLEIPLGQHLRIQYSSHSLPNYAISFEEKQVWTILSDQTEVISDRNWGKQGVAIVRHRVLTSPWSTALKSLICYSNRRCNTLGKTWHVYMFYCVIVINPVSLHFPE